MNNFFYILAFNEANDRVKGVGTHLRTIFSKDVVEVKARSKNFMSFAETTASIGVDFGGRIKTLYPDEEIHRFNAMTVMNPKYVTGVPETDFSPLMETAPGWEGECCATIFYCELGGEGDEEAPVGEWLCKYDVYVKNDEISVVKNGEYAITVLGLDNSPTSSYH